MESGPVRSSRAPDDRPWRARLSLRAALAGGSAAAITAGTAAGALGLGFFLYYYSHGLTLVHYDAKARLLVARRIFDSVCPDIRQMGIYWLPLPSLVNLPAVINDTLYKNGMAASLISVCLFAVATYFLYRIVYLLRNDHTISTAAAAVFATNPSMLYLQTTPLTEALYFSVFLGAAYFLMKFMLTEDRHDLLAAGAFVSLSTLVRYDGWSLWAGLLVLFFIYLLQLERPWRVRGKYLLAFAIASTVGIVAYQLYCYYTTGLLFPPQADARPLIPYSKGKAIESFLIFVRCGGDIAGKLVFYASIVGFLVFLVHRRFRRPYLAAYAVLHSIPLFTLAYFNGHPYRVRYSMALLPAIAIFAVAWWPARNWAKVALAALIAANMIRPAARRQIMLKEASYHAPEIAERAAAIDFLRRNYDGEPVLVSMGWLAPFLHDWGIPLRCTLHESLQGTWDLAIARPARFAGWIIMEKNDPVWNQMRDNPKFLTGFSEALRLSNFRIYRRVHH